MSGVAKKKKNVIYLNNILQLHHFKQMITK